MAARQLESGRKPNDSAVRGVCHRDTANDLDKCLRPLKAVFTLKYVVPFGKKGPNLADHGCAQVLRVGLVWITPRNTMLRTLARQAARAGAQAARGFAAEAGPPPAAKKGGVSDWAGPARCSLVSLANRCVASTQAAGDRHRLPARVVPLFGTSRRGRQAVAGRLRAGVLPAIAACSTACSTPSHLFMFVPNHCHAHAAVQSALPLFIGLAGAGGGLYYAKENGYLDSLLGMPPNPSTGGVRDLVLPATPWEPALHVEVATRR